MEGGECREGEYRTASTSCLIASKEEEEVEGGTVNSNCLPLNGICNEEILYLKQRILSLHTLYRHIEVGVDKTRWV